MADVSLGIVVEYEKWIKKEYPGYVATCEQTSIRPVAATLTMSGNLVNLTKFIRDTEQRFFARVDLDTTGAKPAYTITFLSQESLYAPPPSGVYGAGAPSEAPPQAHRRRHGERRPSVSGDDRDGHRSSSGTDSDGNISTTSRRRRKRAKHGTGSSGCNATTVIMLSVAAAVYMLYTFLVGPVIPDTGASA